MIKISNKIIDKTIQYLNTNYCVDDTVYIKILEDYDCVMDKDGEMGWAVLNTETKTIYIPALVSPIDDSDKVDYEEEIIRRIAHEYKHFLQMCNGEELWTEQCEDDAENFADKIVTEILGGTINVNDEIL